MALINITQEFSACANCNPLPPGRAGPRVNVVLDDEPGDAALMTFQLPDDRVVGWGLTGTTIHGICPACHKGVLTRLACLALALGLAACSLTPDTLGRIGAAAGAQVLDGAARILRDSTGQLDGELVARTVTAGVVGAVEKAVDTATARTLDRAEGALRDATGDLRGELRALAGDIRDETRRALAEALQALQVAVGGVLAALGVSKAGPLVARALARPGRVRKAGVKQITTEKS